MEKFKPIIERVREYILTYTALVDSGVVNIGYLPSEINSFSIEEVPSENGGVISEDIIGNSERQFMFVFAAQFPYSEEVATMIENSGFFQKFQEWLEEQNENEVFPKLEKGMKAIKISYQTTGYLFYVHGSMETARYQIQCKLIYENETL